MADIFLSHSSADNDAAAQIKSWLERDRKSWSVFLDKHPRDGIVAGQGWQDRLRSELQSCRAVLAIITPDWLASRWCFTEAVTATFRGKDFVGVLPGDLPAGALNVAPPVVHERQRQRIDLITGAGWEELLHALDQSGLDPSHWFSIPEGVGPYPGFVAFEEKDAGVFFGRDVEITEYLDALNLLKAPDRAQALVISGGSGSGKSSLLKAGLIPRLRQQPDWLIVPPFDLSREPIHALFSALRAAAEATGVDIDLPPRPPQSVKDLTQFLQDSLRVIEEKANAWLLLSLDQAEGLLAGARRGSETDAFRLLTAAGELLASRTRKLVTVLTIRTEFMPALDRALPSAVRLHDRSLRSITALSEIIEKPAARFGIQLEEGLTGRMVEDTRGADALPLLAYTLRELYEKYADDNLLTVAEYEQLGGVEGAIEKKLHEALTDPEPTADELAAFRRCFVRQLVRVDESAVEGKRYLRTAVARDALPHDASRIIDRLQEARLLVAVDDGAIGIAHERLISNWADVPLQTWLAEDSDDRKLIDNLKSFLAAHRDGGPLLSEKPLLDAKHFLERDRSIEDDEPELAQFIQASVTAEQTRQRRQKWFLGGAFAASLVFLVVAITAWWFRVEALHQADLAKARQLVAQSELSRPDVGASEESVLLALESLRLSETSEAAAAVRKTLAVLAQGKLKLTHDGAVEAIAFSADGRYLATGGSDGRASVWIIESGEEELRVEHEQAITDLSLHPQGLFLATAGRDGKAILWDVSSRQEIYRHETGTIEIEYSTLRDPKMRRRKEQAEVTAVVFSQNGENLAVAGADGVLTIIDVRSQRPLFSKDLDESERQVRFSPDGRLVAALRGKEIVLWNLADGERYGAIPADSAEDLQFDPTGRYIATAHSDDRIGLWDVGSQKLVAEFRHDERASQVQFAPEGDVLWSSGADGTIRQWDIETRREGQRIDAGGGWVRLLAISGDGDYIASADFGNVARLWKTADGSEVVRFPHEAQISTIAFAPDNEHLAVGSVDGVARIWNLRGGSPAVELEHGREVEGFAFSEDGASIVTVGGFLGKNAKVWRLPEGRRLSTHEVDGVGNAAALAADGKRLIQTTGHKVLLTDLAGAVAVREIALEGVEISERDYSVGDVAISRNGLWIQNEIDGTRRLWRIGDRNVELRKTFPSSVRAVAFSPDNARLITVAATGDATTELIEIHDLETDQMVASWSSDERIHFFAISPDNRLLAMPETAFSRGWTIWEGRTTFRLAGSAISIVKLATGEPETHVTIPNVAAPNQIEMIAFSSDGQFLAAGLADGMTSVVRVEDSEEVARLPHGARLAQIAFSPDQDYLVTAGADGFVRFWRWRTSDLYAAACARITRNFEYREWTKYLGDESYRLTCENLPPHPSLLEQARLLVERGKVKEAKALLDRALQLGATIDAAPDDWVDQAAAVGLLDDGVSLAKSGRIEAALDAFDKARRLDPKVKISYQDWAAVCWQGALSRSAGTVIEACEHAVEGAQENGGVHDSRGVVRAQLGDYKGAIADFQAYLAWAPNNDRPEEDIAKRRQWIQKLEQGVDPFDADTLKALQ